MRTIGTQIHMVTPMDTNPHGTIFGGKVMELADQAAAICARNISAKPVLTAALDKIDFLNPIYVGEEACLDPKLVCSFRRSMQIAVEVKAVNPLTGVERMTARTLFTFVAVDPVTLQPIEIPSFPVNESAEAKACRLRYQGRKKHNPSEPLPRPADFPAKAMDFGESPGKTPSASLVENHHLVLPGDHNSLDFLFAGRYLAWVDILGALSARRHCRKPVVTVSIEEVEFKVRIPKGSTIRLVGKPIFVSDNSVQVQVTGWLWNDDFGGTDRKIADAFLTFVPLDFTSKTSDKIPKLIPTNDEEREAFLWGQWRYLKRKKKTK